MLDKLTGKQDKDGSLSGSTTSVVGSGGEALAIETTSLAVLAWLRHGGFTAEVERSIQFLAESCKAGRFGSTQSTVLALKAIIAYNQARSKPKAPGRLQLVVNGKEVGEPVAFDAQTQGALELPCPGELLSAGKHTIQVRMIDGCEMPYSISVDYHSLTPDSSDACKVRLEAKLRQQKVEEGAVTEAVVTLTNRTEESIPTPMAIIGVPGGLEVRHDHLKELVKAGKIAAYEVLGRDLVLYWRAMSPSQQIELPISLTAAVPGTYTGPASRAYLYYTDEHKQWLEGLKVTITPRQ
jgi:alpha-2-macroglobulin-like protein